MAEILGLALPIASSSPVKYKAYIEGTSTSVLITTIISAFTSRS